MPILGSFLEQHGYKAILFSKETLLVDAISDLYEIKRDLSSLYVVFDFKNGHYRVAHALELDNEANFDDGIRPLSEQSVFKDAELLTMDGQISRGQVQQRLMMNASLRFVVFDKNNEIWVLSNPTRIGQAHAKQTVLFSVFAPLEVEKGKEYGLYVYTYTPSDLSSVTDDIHQFEMQLGTTGLKKTASEAARLRLKSPLAVTPESSMTFDPPQSEQIWMGQWLRFEFRFRPLVQMNEADIPIRVSITVKHFEIAHVDLTLRVIQQEENPLARAKFARQNTQLYQSIFISYSRQDKDVANSYRLAQLAVGNNVFLDVESIKPGEDWQAALADAIDKADIFQLFWSDHSSKSVNVRREWQYALQYRCKNGDCHNFIRPVFWKKPMPAPPEELNDLNFKFIPFR